MKACPPWPDTLNRHVEDTWEELLNLVALCLEENLITPGLLKFELVSLRQHIEKGLAANDYVELMDCSTKCKHLLLYCKALQNQSRRAKGGSIFAQHALQRLTHRA